jgi:orotidine-5'-phosphate decarboxylase
VLISKIKKLDNPSIIGLDPKLEYVPDFIKKDSFKKYGETLAGAADAIFTFNKGIIDETFDIVPAIKPQSAYYEMYGYEGVKALYDTICYAKNKGMYVITDVKRNDIGSTAESYSKAYLGKVIVGQSNLHAFDSDGITVNPYLGTDGILPFMVENKTIFILVKTSNKSSFEIQDLISNGKPIYNYVAELVNDWGENSVGKEGYSNVGAVVGATYPEQAKTLRKIMKKTYFLVPGYGAQGGSGKDVSVCFNDDGLGAIVNSSRGIMCAYIKENIKETDYAKCARNAADKMKKEITSYIK